MTDNSSSQIDPLLLELLVCPRDHTALGLENTRLRCSNGHKYPVVDGIPVMLLHDAPQTQYVIGRSLQETYFPKGGEPDARDSVKDDANQIDDFVQSMVAMTCGQLYAPMVGTLRRYPIPSTRLPAGRGRLLLDIGCNWGRWSIAASRQDYRAIGIDPNLQAILAARRVAEKLGSSATFVVGDARFLPFAASSLDCAFSYSVFQHFSRADAIASIEEIARTLTADGVAFIQMANRAGIRSLYHQARRRFRDARDFEVRYWSIGELREVFETIIGPSSIVPDCYFGLGVQPADRDMLPKRYQAVVAASELVRNVAQRFPVLQRLADSVYVQSFRRPTPRCSK